jgi:hypothetical protein
MEKEPWSKGRVGKIKNSPAVQTWKESNSVGDFIDKSLDYLSPNSNTHRDRGNVSGRNAEYDHGLHFSQDEGSTCATCSINEMQG